MKKYPALLLVLAVAAALPLDAEIMKGPEGYIDEGNMPIIEDTPTIENIPVVDAKTDRAARNAAPSTSGTLIMKYFKDDNTFVIICKGYPKPGVESGEARGTAREAALINAQVLAGEVFKSGINVITAGSPERYIDGKGYAMIYYIVRHPGLRKYAK
ncbi:MAG TPA: hypothetical protein VLM75_14140 [Spirochaetota bacterium]|nr:hypothetical protein [Spirochaetota bacterium]